MARMEPEDATGFTKDYFEAGGELITVTEWLRDRSSGQKAAEAAGTSCV